MRVGVFDSGLGGLTILRAIVEQVHGVELFYLADTRYAPYGEKSPHEILQRTLAITEYFLSIHQIDALVIACNTATSSAISTLRHRYPQLLIVGTEPALKPAIEQTHTGAVGVLATPATLQGDKYQTLADTLSTHRPVTLYEQACAGLVEAIETNRLTTPQSLARLEGWLAPMRVGGVDTIVLGCTHYPLAKSVIAQVMQREVRLLDSGEAIAKRLLSLLEGVGHHNRGENRLYLYTTGKIDRAMVSRILPSYVSLEEIVVEG